jgi:hypothetical protein
MYDAPLPRTKPVSIHPAARLRGRLVVGDLVLDVDDWPGMVGHNWGSEHAERWIWLHGSAFGDDPDSWLDVVLARLRIGRRTTPWSGFGALCLDGRTRRFGGLSRVRSTRVDEHPDRLAFSLTGDHVRVHGTVSAPLARFVGWEYADPDGSGHDVAHCSIADLEVTLEEGGGRPPSPHPPQHGHGGVRAGHAGARPRPDHPALPRRLRWFSPPRSRTSPGAPGRWPWQS